MVRIATVRKIESEQQRAIQYIRNSILLPSALLGLISIILGYGALIYLLFKSHSLTSVVVDSLVLLGVGALLGGIQCLYHRFLFENHPDYYAARRRKSEQMKAGRLRKIEMVSKPEHRGRWMVPYLYMAAYAGAITLMVMYAMRLNPLSAIFLLLAGFYNVRFFFWKRKLRI